MSHLANLYPGHPVVDLCVIVAAAVALVSAAAWIVSLSLERHPPICHCVLLSALVTSLASPLLAFAFVASGTSFITIPLLAVTESPNAAAARGDRRHFNELPPLSSPRSLSPATTTDPAVAGPSPDNLDAAEVTPAAASPFPSTVVAALLLWLCGTVVSTVGLARSWLLLNRLRRCMQPLSDAEFGGALNEAKRLLDARTSPTVMVSPLARTPLAAGWFRPVIVLPDDLLGAISREQLRDVLMHEIAHIERFDNLIVLLQAIARAAFWPIPFVHLLSRQLERAREDICDNHVLACRDAVTYGETLLRLAQLARGAAIPVGTVGILHWRGKLEERIFGLIHKGRSKLTRTHPLIAVFVFVLSLSATAVLCGTTIVQARGDDKPQEKPKDGSAKADELQKALGELSKTYALAKGEDVKCVKPPFPAARQEWFRVENFRRTMFVAAGLPAGAPPNGTLFTFRWNQSVLKHTGIHNGDGRAENPGCDLVTWFESVAGVSALDVEGDEDLLKTRIAADFIVREGVPADKIISGLETILRTEFQTPVKLSLREVERKVSVANGKYRFVPVEGRPKDRVELYAKDIINNKFSADYIGTFPEFLQGISRFIGKRAVVAGKIEDAPKRTHWHESIPENFSSQEEADAAHDPESVLKHLKEQTGLSFSEELRPVRVLFVERMEQPASR